MLVSILSLILSTSIIQAEEIPQQVIASCECTVLNDAGVPIRSPHSSLGAVIPVVPGYHEVHGVGKLKSDYERKNCVELDNGELSLACAVAAVKAQHNASYKCGKIAHRYHPDQIDGFLNGQIEPDSCFLTLD